MHHRNQPEYDLSMSTDYHGVKPVTDDDKDMAEKHLKATRKMAEEKSELLQDKIDDHKKALMQATKDGNKRSMNYNKAHLNGHQSDLDDVDAEQNKIGRSLKTLGSLRTHSRKTYNDVRNAKVKLMYRKSGGDSVSAQ